MPDESPRGGGYLPGRLQPGSGWKGLEAVGAGGARQPRPQENLQGLEPAGKGRGKAALDDSTGQYGSRPDAAGVLGGDLDMVIKTQ